MQENPQVGKPIDLGDLQKQASEVGQKALEIKTLLEKDFFSPAMTSIFGKYLLGSEKNKKVNPDGSIEEVDWSMGDFMEAWQKAGEEEIAVRKALAQDIVIGLSAQERFFQTTEHPLRDISATNTEFATDLLERVLASKEEIADPYPFHPVDEEYWTAELLEVIRRTVLRPTTLLLEGYGRSGIHSVPGYDDLEFWEEREGLVTEDMKKELKTGTTADYLRLEDERIKRSLKEKTEEEWIGILGKESIYFLSYLKAIVRRSLCNAQENARLAPLWTLKGQRLFGDELVSGLNQKAEEFKTINEEIEGINDFSKVLPWIKTKFGVDFTFREFLQLLNPIVLDSTETKTS